MPEPDWELNPDERTTFNSILDLLLPPSGSFPAPSATGIIDDFILKRVPPAGDGTPAYPGLDSDDLKDILGQLTGVVSVATLQQFEREQPIRFQALWSLAVYGYYSRPETIAAIQQDLAPGYHGAPLPGGYEHVIAPWDPDDPLQMPRNSPGSYLQSDEVRRADLSILDIG